jgi:hypothetical protein
MSFAEPLFPLPVYRFLELLEKKPNITYIEIPPEHRDALWIARRSKLVETQNTGWGEQALEHEVYYESLNPAHWLSPVGKDALALYRLWQAGVVSNKPKAESVDEPEPGNNLEQHMARVAQAIGDDYAVHVLAIAGQKDRSGEERMEEILRLDRRFAGKNSAEWGTLLGVSAAAIRGYKSWKRLQEGKKAGD